MYSYGSPHTAAQKQDDQHERTFSSYVRIRDVVLKTYLGRWTIGRSGERGSGISVLPARYDDDDDDDDDDIYSERESWMFWYRFNAILKFVAELIKILESEPNDNIEIYNLQYNNIWRCPWCNGYRRRKWTRRKWTRTLD